MIIYGNLWGSFLGENTSNEQEISYSDSDVLYPKVKKSSVKIWETSEKTSLKCFALLV